MCAVHLDVHISVDATGTAKVDIVPILRDLQGNKVTLVEKEAPVTCSRQINKIQGVMLKALVQVPVTDLRSKPVLGSHSYEIDRLQETQLLYGDSVDVLEEMDEWVRVEVPDQKIFDLKEGWKSYPGFVQKKHLLFGRALPQFNRVVTKKWVPLDGASFSVSMGTRLQVVRQEGEKLVIQLVDGKLATVEAQATEFSGLENLLCHLGDPYLWGGLSSFSPSCFSGIDCSGLTYLYFRLQGKEIPRNARDQYKIATSLSGKNLVPGDLIFKHNLQKGYIDHVMLYFGDEKILEATALTRSVRIVSTKEKLGAQSSEINSEYVFDNNSFSFGRI